MNAKAPSRNSLVKMPLIRNAFAEASKLAFRYNPCDFISHFYFSVASAVRFPLVDISTVHTRQPMRKAVLLYNPLSGQRHLRRIADVEAALTILRQAGVEATSGAHPRPGGYPRTGAPRHRRRLRHDLCLWRRRHGT